MRLRQIGVVKFVGMHLTRAGAVPVTKAISFENSIKRRFTAKSCSQRHKKGRRIREIVLNSRTCRRKRRCSSEVEKPLGSVVEQQAVISSRWRPVGRRFESDQRREKLAQNELRLNGYVRLELFERTLLSLNPTRLRRTSLEPE